MLKSEEILLLLPQIILAIGAVLAMLSIAVKRNHFIIHKISVLTLLLALISLSYVHFESVTHVTSLFVIDGLGWFFTGLILVSALFIAVFSYSYLAYRYIRKEEYYVLLLLATLGSSAMVISNHFMSFFLSLEVLSVSLYALIAYLTRGKRAIEAGIKYLFLAAFSASIILMGFAFIYAQTGQMELSAIGAALPAHQDSILFISGLGLIIAGLGFKLALVPFHFWTPDIYAGASAPVSAFVATISKGAVFAFLLRLYINLDGGSNPALWSVFALLSASSMLIGNWLALRQENIKRLLAYSSIGHLGYLLIPMLANSETGVKASVFYLVTYFVSMLAAFGIIGFLSEKRKDAFELSQYRGLFWRRPWSAALLTITMLSLAGIPLTAGFMGKFYLLLSGVGSKLWMLTVILVISSTIGLFYYLRVVISLFAKEAETKTFKAYNTSVSGGIALGVLFILLLWIGIYPSTLFSLLNGIIGM